MIKHFSNGIEAMKVIIETLLCTNLMFHDCGSCGFSDGIEEMLLIIETLQCTDLMFRDCGSGKNNEGIRR